MLSYFASRFFFVNIIEKLHGELCRQAAVIIAAVVNESWF